MARIKKWWSGTSDEVILQANQFLKDHPGWEPIQLTYSSKKNVQIIAFTAVQKKGSAIWKFVTTQDFTSIAGTKDVGVFYEEDVAKFVGVPIPSGAGSELEDSEEEI